MHVFDIIGPIMIGPSSSHTAGAARIGRITRMLLGEPVRVAHIRFHGSFAKTWEGHGADRAVIGGLLGLQVDDADLRRSRHLAAEQGMKYDISPIQLRDAPGAIAKVSRLLAASRTNIATMRVFREEAGGRAVMALELDSEPEETHIDALRRVPGFESVTLLRV